MTHQLCVLMCVLSFVCLTMCAHMCAQLCVLISHMQVGYEIRENELSSHVVMSYLISSQFASICGHMGYEIPRVHKPHGHTADQKHIYSRPHVYTYGVYIYIYICIYTYRQTAYIHTADHMYAHVEYVWLCTYKYIRIHMG